MSPNSDASRQAWLIAKRDTVPRSMPTNETRMDYFFAIEQGRYREVRPIYDRDPKIAFDHLRDSLEHTHIQHWDGELIEVDWEKACIKRTTQADYKQYMELFKTS
ncbi:hypothetical protein KS4_23850 [Poriferisphaera corsica]|uniref:Uncharacterized protein n=1 Tax=Poriferisphaera corsica TaxID=2528020 RepID=A0A517YVQ8_9BACT|nr:hypothetical protein [Poriferisphaera corsica]QDU34317.1 hypothetical protein KS4_23850 [Poriferisphaera corsica]